MERIVTITDLGKLAKATWFATKGNEEASWNAVVDVILEEAAKTTEAKACEIPECERTASIAFQECADAIRWMKST
jgi:hypothetical protein